MRIVSVKSKRKFGLPIGDIEVRAVLESLVILHLHKIYCILMWISDNIKIRFRSLTGTLTQRNHNERRWIVQVVGYFRS